MKVQDIDVDERKLAEFCRARNIRELLIFGSATRDDFRSDSDIDLAIDYQPDAKVSLFDFAGHQTELTEILGREVHLTERSTIPAELVEHVLAGAVRAYAV